MMRIRQQQGLENELTGASLSRVGKHFDVSDLSKDFQA
jgi:hypothetical protein